MSKVSLVLLLTAFAAVPALAQESRAVIGGTVTDPQGAVVPGATVQVKNVATNVITKAICSEASPIRKLTTRAPFRRRCG